MSVSEAAWNRRVYPAFWHWTERLARKRHLRRT